MTWGDEHERGGDGVIRVGRRLGAAACVRGLCHDGLAEPAFGVRF